MISLDFAKFMAGKDISFWENTIFVNESEFNIFATDGRITTWRKSSKQLNQKKILSEHSKTGIMVWGCFDVSVMGNLFFNEKNMDQYKYINILKESLKIFTPKFGIQNTFKLCYENGSQTYSQQQNYSGI